MTNFLCSQNNLYFLLLVLTQASGKYDLYSSHLQNELH